MEKELFRWDNTAKVKYMAENNLYKIPPTPKGKEIYKFKVGQKVAASGTGTYTAGLTGTVTKREKVHGFARYSVKWDHYNGTTTERQKDLV